MSVNSTGAIGYEAKTDPKGRVTVTYQGKTTTYKNYNEFVELFKKQYDAKHPPVKDEKGTTVQKNPDDKQLTDEQKAKKSNATKLELQEMEEAKVLAKQKNLQNALAVAEKTGDENKINAAKVVLYEFENANRATLASAAARLNETGKVETRGATTRIVGNAEDSALQIDPHRTAPTTVKEVKSKKQRRQEIKANASYKAEDGTVIKGKDNLIFLLRISLSVSSFIFNGFCLSLNNVLK